MECVTAKSSTIFIATSSATRVYRSLGEVPPHLLAKLQTSVSGTNSATIIIADRRGREELVRALQGQRSHVQSRLAEAIRSRNSGEREKSEKQSFSLRRWLERFVPVALGASLWFLSNRMKAFSGSYISWNRRYGGCDDCS